LDELSNKLRVQDNRYKTTTIKQRFNDAVSYKVMDFILYLLEILGNVWR